VREGREVQVVRDGIEHHSRVDVVMARSGDRYKPREDQSERVVSSPSVVAPR